MANISKVYLLDTPLEDDLKHTLYFSSSSAQHTYMEGRIEKTYVNVSYQRDTSTFRCPAHIDTIRTCNYMMYQNTAYSNKWFYCFIEKMTYVNDGMTDVQFKVDPIQTFMFDFDTQPSFIEREHTTNDTRGANTVPENFELGEYVYNKNNATNSFGIGNTMWYAVGVSEIVGSLDHTPSATINGIPSGLYYIYTDNMSALQTIVYMYDLYGKAGAIYSMFIFPRSLATYSGGNMYQSATWSYNKDGHSGYVNVYVPKENPYVFRDTGPYNVTIPTKLDIYYQPRNQKLLTYPFCFFNVTNNVGSTVTYHYEDFDGTPSFYIEGIISTGCSIKLFPTNYKNMDWFGGANEDNTYDYGLNMAKFPTISWNSDSYTNWLTQNSMDIALRTAKTVGSLAVSAGGIATGNPLLVSGGVASTLSSVSDIVKQNYEAQLVPNQVEGNTNVGDLNYAKNKNKFTIYPMSIKQESARIIDDYFDMFGYKTCRVKKPNYNHRENWWYTKTVDIYIKGDIPNEYMNEIKNAYNNGITYWRNPNNFMNYSVSNGIVS